MAVRETPVARNYSMPFRFRAAHWLGKNFGMGVMRQWAERRAEQQFNREFSPGVRTFQTQLRAAVNDLEVKAPNLVRDVRNNLADVNTEKAALEGLLRLRTPQPQLIEERIRALNLRLGNWKRAAQKLERMHTSLDSYRNLLAEGQRMAGAVHPYTEMLPGYSRQLNAHEDLTLLTEALERRLEDRENDTPLYATTGDVDREFEEHSEVINRARELINERKETLAKEKAEKQEKKEADAQKAKKEEEEKEEQKKKDTEEEAERRKQAAQNAHDSFHSALDSLRNLHQEFVARNPKKDTLKNTEWRPLSLIVTNIKRQKALFDKAKAKDKLLKGAVSQGHTEFAEILKELDKIRKAHNDEKGKKKQLPPLPKAS